MRGGIDVASNGIRSGREGPGIAPAVTFATAGNLAEKVVRRWVKQLPPELNDIEHCHPQDRTAAYPAIKNLSLLYPRTEMPVDRFVNCNRRLSPH
jgi:hypothetical protein